MRRCHCGEDHEKCSDPAIVWHMRRDVCHKTVALESAKRIHDDEYKDAPFHDGTFTRWAKEFSPETPAHFMDGVTISVTEATPSESVDDDGLRR